MGGLYYPRGHASYCQYLKDVTGQRGSIRDALRKSRCVTVLLTPTLYVMPSVLTVAADDAKP